MDLELKGCRVLVTGSSRGIGFSIAKAFLNEGCAVVLNSKNSVSLTKSVKLLETSGSCFGVTADVTKVTDTQKLISKTSDLLGGLDILVCNVGSGRSVKAGTESKKDWEKMLGINFFSTTNVVEAARTELSESKGSVICITSICGLEVIPGAPVTYSVAKAALNAYIRGIARPLAKNEIRINGIAPGNIMFEDSVWNKKMAADPDAVEKMLNENVPLKCFGTTGDIANLSLWLASPVSKFVTGSIYTMDGGQTKC